MNITAVYCGQSPSGSVVPDFSLRTEQERWNSVLTASWTNTVYLWDPLFLPFLSPLMFLQYVAWLLFIFRHCAHFWGFPGSPVGKESSCNAVDPCSIPGSGRPPGGGHGKPLQYSYLENSMDRGAWWAIVHGITKSWTWLSEIIHESIQNSRIWFCFVPLWSKFPLPSGSNACMNICLLGRTSLVVQGLRTHLAMQ